MINNEGLAFVHAYVSIIQLRADQNRTTTINEAETYPRVYLELLVRKRLVTKYWKHDKWRYRYVLPKETEIDLSFR